MTFKALELLRSLLDGLAAAFAPRNILGATLPAIHFRPAVEACPRCGGTLKVRKTRTGRRGFTLHVGGFEIRETVLGCDSCAGKPAYRSEELTRLFPWKCNFGFDVIVHVGRRLFLDNRTVREVRAELADRNVEASESEVDFLGRKFIAYLAVAHRGAASRLREIMERNGGYMLHIDATCEGGGPMLLSGMDAVTSTVLWNLKIPTEKADHAVPFLREIERMYGRPLLVVADMSKAFESAVREVFGQDMRMLICHFHFLRDVGKDMLSNDYDSIRRRLRKLGAGSKLRQRLRHLRATVDANPELLEKLASESPVQGKMTAEEWEAAPALVAYFLIQWALAGKRSGDAYGFPFDLPLACFASRVREAFLKIKSFVKSLAESDGKRVKPLLKTAGDMIRIAEDNTLNRALKALDEKTLVFNDLRKALRIAPLDGERGLNDDGGDEPIGKIEARVAEFRENVTGKPGWRASAEHVKMIKQIDENWDRLFADPVVLDTPNGKISIQPQRTNNIMEQFFRRVRRAHRRRTGDNAMGRRIKAMNANSLLVKNLENPQYMAMLLDGRGSLEDVFADIDAAEAREQMSDAAENVERIPSKVKKMIKTKDFLPKMMEKLRLVMP